MKNTPEKLAKAEELLGDEERTFSIREKFHLGRWTLFLYEYVAESPTGVLARMHLEKDEKAFELIGRFGLMVRPANCPY